MHEKYSEMFEIINTLRIKVMAIASEIGRTYELCPEGGILSNLKEGTSEKPPNDLIMGRKGIGSLLSRLHHAEKCVQNAHNHYQDQALKDEAWKKVSNCAIGTLSPFYTHYCNTHYLSAEDSVECAERDYEAIEKRLRKWRRNQKIGHGKKDKTKYIPEKHLPLIVKKYIDYMPQAKQKNIYQIVCEEISEEHDLSISTIQHKAKEGTIKKEISRLKRLEKKTKKTAKKTIKKKK